MMATGLWLENAADAARIHSGLITSHNALRLDRSKNKGDDPYKALLSQGSVAGGFQVVHYSVRWSRTRKTRAILLEGLADNPRKWLGAKLEEALAEFEKL